MLWMESGASGTHMMQNMNPVGPFGGFSIMNYIGHQVIGGDLLCGLRLFCQVLPQINIPIVHECFHNKNFSKYNYREYRNV